jgi:ABC-type Fe3+ transport system permease subunit
MPEDDAVLKALEEKLTAKLRDVDATPDAAKQLLSLRKEYLEQNEARKWAFFHRVWWSIFFVAIILVIIVAAVFAVVWWLRKG